MNSTSVRLEQPENPTKEGYTFYGWYWDKDIWKEPFTANSLLTISLSSDMGVYARFIDENTVLGTNVNFTDFEKVDSTTFSISQICFQ